MKVIIEDNGFEGNQTKIVIDKDRKRVYAESFLIRECNDELHVIRFSALTKTHPNDKFDEELGVRLAKRRLSLKMHKFLVKEAQEYKNEIEKELTEVNKFLEKEQKKVDNVSDSINKLMEDIHNKAKASKNK